MDPKSWPKGPHAGRTGRRRLLLQSWPLKSQGLKVQNRQGPAGSPPTPSALQEEVRLWEGKAQPAQGHRVAPAPSGQYTSKWLPLKRSQMPESLGAWSPAKGTAGGQAAAAMAEPARLMRPQPSQTSHRHWRRYPRTQPNGAPLLPQPRRRGCCSRRDLSLPMRWALGFRGCC